MGANKKQLRKTMLSLYINYYDMVNGYSDEDFLLEAIHENLQSEEGVEWEINVCDKIIQDINNKNNMNIKNMFYMEFIKLKSNLQQLLNEYKSGERKSRVV